jgi:hypothetical protein
MPEATEVRPESVVTSDAPVSRVSTGEVAQPYQMLGQALDKAGEGLEALATPLAERAGLQSVTMDDQGNMSVAHTPIFGEAGIAYSRAMKFSALAQADGEAKRQDIAISKQFPNDPDQYLAASNKFRDTLVQKVTDQAGPEVGLSLSRAIDTTTTFNYRRLANEQQQKITQNFDRDTRAAIESKSEDLKSLILNGGVNTPQAKQLITDIHALVNERTSSPLLQASKGEADLFLNHLHQDMNGAAFENYVGKMLKNPSAPYQPMINDSAQRYGLDPNLLARQLYQESGFRTNAVSPAGAQGIAQFMPATAARYGVNVRDPQSSIEGQARYMSDLTKQFGGNTGLALAGYNWGEKNVAQWMAAGANPAAMPAETRNYVRAITGQPIEGWISGQRPSPLAMQGQPGGPGTMQGGVERALAAVEAMRTDESVPPAQRQINYEKGLAAIKEYRDDVVRQTNLADLGQKQRDQTFEDSVIKDRASDSPQITENEIKTATDVSPESKMRMLSWVKREDMPEPIAKVSQSNAMDLFRRMSLDETDPGKISDLKPVRDAYIAGALTRADEEWLEKRFTDARTAGGDRLAPLRAQFSKAVEPLIDNSNPIMGKIDASGKMQNFAFERYVDQKIDEYRAAKKSPFDLFDPSKPDYLGKPEVIAPFQKSLKDSMAEMTRKMTGQGAPGPVMPAAAQIPKREPGETLDEFDKRTGLR